MSSDQNWIHFYNKDEKYFEFSNYFVHKKSLLIDGKSYKSVEHYYQSMKFLGPDPDKTELTELAKHYSELIRLAKTPNMARIYAVQKCSQNYDWAKKLKATISSFKEKGLIFDEEYWSTIKDDVMFKALTEKFNQDIHCREMLLKTTDSILSENSGSRDCYWGNSVKDSRDPTKIGKLGSMLMKIRENLLKD